MITNHPVYPTVEVTSAATIAATVLGYLPDLAVILCVAWYGVLFYDRFMSKDKKEK